MASIDRLRELVDGAFNWFVHNLELFDPFKLSIEPDIFYSKPLLELACTCMFYERCIQTDRDPRVRQFISFIHDVWQRPEYRERLVRNPEMLRMYGMTCIALVHCGAGEHSYHEIFQRVLDQGYATAVEEVPYRCLDLRNMLDCGGFRHNLPSYISLYQKTLLAATPPLLYLTTEDVYSITHTLFYLSDFGACSVDAILEEQLPTVRWMIGALLGIFLRLRNWDLVAELLICCRCLRWSPPSVFEAAWEGLLDAQFPDGSVPGPTFSKDKMQQLSESEQRTYYVKQNYHTTLVMRTGKLFDR